MGISLFKSSKEPTITDRDIAIADLKALQTNIDRQKKRINAIIEKERKAAIQFKKQNEIENAKRCIRLIRYQKNLLEKAEINYENAEKMIEKIMEAEMNVRIMESLRKGNNALKELQSIITIEEVEDILSETEMAIEKQREIDEILQRNSFLTEEEEIELQKELMNLSDDDEEIKEEKEDKVKEKKEEEEIKEEKEVIVKEKKEEKVEILEDA